MAEYYFAQLSVNVTGFRNANVENKNCLFIRLIRHLLAFSNFALGSHHCFLLLWWIVNSVLIMLIEDDCRECVDNNYLKDACHLTAIILHLSSGKIVQNKFRKMISESSRSRSRTTAQTQCRECHNGTSWILKAAAKWKWNRSNGKRCENQN